MKWRLCPHKKPRIRYSASGVWEEALLSASGLFLTPLSVPRKQCERSRAQANGGRVEAQG